VFLPQHAPIGFSELVRLLDLVSGVGSKAQLHTPWYSALLFLHREIATTRDATLTNLESPQGLLNVTDNGRSGPMSVPIVFHAVSNSDKPRPLTAEHTIMGSIVVQKQKLLRQEVENVIYPHVAEVSAANPSRYRQRPLRAKHHRENIIAGWL
jgi:hypothetical protein